ncbi:MAG: universal stress protein [Planctomycetota bacterium]|jgi:nucleotide-binding universal stress UspA family protein
MYPFHRVLVGLALRGKDETTLRYATTVAQMTQTKRMYFLHVMDPRRPMELIPPDETGTWEHDVVMDVVEDLVKKEYQGRPEAEVRCEVVYGPRLKKMIEFAIDKDIDLIVIGSENDASRVFPEKIARNAPCSVLIIPEGSKTECDRILVPTDFSKLSAEAMKVALSCCRLTDSECLVVHHVSRVPQGYHKTGKSYDEVADKVRRRSQKDCDSFLKEFDLEGVPLNVECAVNNRVVPSVTESERENDINIIFIGARGRTGPAAFLLGSVTEKLIRTTKNPVMAVKKKGANMNLLQALFEM